MPSPPCSLRFNVTALRAPAQDERRAAMDGGGDNDDVDVAGSAVAASSAERGTTSYPLAPFICRGVRICSEGGRVKTFCFVAKFFQYTRPLSASYFSFHTFLVAVTATVDATCATSVSATAAAVAAASSFGLKLARRAMRNEDMTWAVSSSVSSDSDDDGSPCFPPGTLTAVIGSRVVIPQLAPMRRPT